MPCVMLASPCVTANLICALPVAPRELAIIDVFERNTNSVVNVFDVTLQACLQASLLLPCNTLHAPMFLPDLHRKTLIEAGPPAGAGQASASGGCAGGQRHRLCVGCQRQHRDQLPRAAERAGHPAQAPGRAAQARAGRLAAPLGRQSHPAG